MFNQYDALIQRIKTLEKEVQKLKDDQIKQNRDYKDMMYNLDTDNIPALQGIVKTVNLAISESGKVTAQFIMETVNGEGNAKILADRITFEGSTVQFLVPGDVTGKFVLEQINADETGAKLNADRIELTGTEFVEIFLKNEDATGKFVIERINADKTGATLNADKIDLEGIEINLKGAEIDLTSDEITIRSDNFNVDEEGNMECNGAVMNSADIKQSCVLASDLTSGEGMQIGKPYQEEWATIRSFLRLFEVSGGMDKGIEFVTTEGSEETVASEKSVILSNNYARLQSYNHTNADVAVAEVYDDYAALDVSTSYHTAKVYAQGDEVRLQFDNVFLAVDGLGVHCGNGTITKDLFQA